MTENEKKPIRYETPFCKQCHLYLADGEGCTCVGRFTFPGCATCDGMEESVSSLQQEKGANDAQGTQ